MAAPPTLKQLRPVRSSLFRITYNPKYAPSRELELQKNDLNPLYIRNSALYERRPKVGLWYWVKATSALSPKRLPRSVARRKVLTAFQEALRSHSLDSQGLVQQSVATARLQRGFVLRNLDMEPAPIDLRGMLYIAPNPNVLVAERADLHDQMGRLVRYLLRYQWLAAASSRKAADG